MMGPLQFRNGLKENLPPEDYVGRPLYTTDTKELFVSNGAGSPLTKIITESALVTVIGSPYTDDTIPTEKAVRDAINNMSLSSGSGDVLGPSSSTDGHIPKFSGITGKLIVDGYSVSGNTSSLTTTSGPLTTGKQLTFDSSGNVIASIYDAGILIGSDVVNVISVSSNYTLTPSDYAVIVNGTSTVTLPTAVGNTGKRYTLKKVSSTGSVVVNTTSSQTIDGQLTYTLTDQYESLVVISDGSSWYII